MAVKADKDSSQTQIHQSVLDVATQALKVNVVAGAGTDGAKETTALAILAAVDGVESSLTSIDNKNPTLVSGRVPVDGSGVTQPVSATSLPLPTGAATETSLSSLNGKVVAVNTGAVVVSSSVLPAGASTSANQVTSNSSLASIDTKTPALGQALAAGSTPVVLTAAQVSTLTPQTNALTDTQLRASAVPVSVADVATETTLAAINTKTPSLVSGASPVYAFGSINGPVQYDYIAFTFPTSTQDVITYRSGGVAGTVVQTITVNYTDSTKGTLANVART